MKRSTDRILSTHAGSLPRPKDLLQLVLDKDRGRPYDAQALDTRLRAAVDEVVSRQAHVGIDIVDDGEFGKASFIHYVNERLTGFEPGAGAPGNPFSGSREFQSFPAFYGAQPPSAISAGAKHMVCVGPIRYAGHQQLATDIANLKAAVAKANVTEAFLPAIAPSDIEYWQSNKYYKTEEEYLFAIADAMHEEYQAIVAAGIVVQIDDPRLVTHYNRRVDWSIADCRKWAEVRVEALNHALRGMPREKVRFHTCYGINMGPRIHDMELRDIVDIIVKIHAGAHSFEAANPRHEHEWSVWKSVKLPEGTILIPGCVTQSSVLVEHPDLVAERIVRFANVVGRENVIAGADCGFGTFAGSEEIHESIAWAKLSALADGARRATRQLWGRA
jgi:5-methyltetrahydropteroyltriglutamate--homocysteine methyltransferase